MVECTECCSLLVHAVTGYKNARRYKCAKIQMRQYITNQRWIRTLAPICKISMICTVQGWICTFARICTISMICTIQRWICTYREYVGLMWMRTIHRWIRTPARIWVEVDCRHRYWIEPAVIGTVPFPRYDMVEQTECCSLLVHAGTRYIRGEVF